jgi:septal ring factor EnvC (AmiA/AmiB activator)
MAMGRLLYAGLFTILFSFAGLQLQAQESQEQLEARRKKIEAEIIYTNKLIEEIKSNKRTTLNQLNLVEAKITSRNNLLANYKLEIHAVTISIQSTEMSIRNLNNDLKKLKKEYAKVAWYTYQYRTSYNKLIFLFSAESINQAYQRMRYLDQLSVFIRTQAKEIAEKEKEKTAALSTLQTKKDQLSTLMKHESSEVYALENEKKDKEKVTASFSGRERELRKSLKSKEKEADKLASQIEAIIALETKPKPVKGKPASYTLTPEERILSNSFVANKGKLPWPLERGVVSETYGVHKHPILKRVQTKNNGVDLSTEKNSEARCIFDGVVASVTRISNTNIAVIVKHGDYFTVYSNLDEVIVKKGDRVSTRQILGRVHTNLKGETELHFEVRKGVSPQNPVYWMAK